MRDRNGPVAAVILAAGLSRRVGRPKSLLPLAGGTCLDLVIEACRGGGAAPIHLVTGHRAALVESAARNSGVLPVRNTSFLDGQLSSLQAGLRSLPPDVAGVIAFPVDYPLVSADVPRRLIRAFRDAPEGDLLFLPTFDGVRGHPYLFDASLVAEYLALGGGRVGRDVVRADPSRVREVPVPEQGILFDLDTPDDFVRMRLWDGKIG